MFGFIKKAFSKVYEQVTSKLRGLFARETVDEDTLSELERILISADTGIHTTRSIIKFVRTQAAQGKLKQGADLEKVLYEYLIKLLSLQPYTEEAEVYLLVGINGSGKTTFASKLANRLLQQGKKVLLVAADTFRAAATEQLQEWGKKLNIDVVTGSENQDPASVVYAGCEQFKNGEYDVLIIDTAGRLQTKINLMKELEKIRKIISKQLSDSNIATLLTVDAMLGQNSFDQAQLFNECTNLTGIVLTKMDGTAKGGIIFSITEQLKIPIAYVSFGEQMDQISKFDSQQYVQGLLGRS